MKRFTNIILSVAVCASLANAEKIKHVFEPEKDTSGFDKVEFNFNGDLTFTYQGLSDNYGDPIKSGLSLPTANLDINAKIMSGFNVKLETMLSSHHHHETFVKGGYASMDNLDFVYKGFAKDFMDHATIKVGVNDINYGDYHFRRTDNADVFRNPFVNNMGVEAYMQAGFVELMYRLPSIDSFFVTGVTNGEVNPDDVSAGNGKGAYSYYGKFGYDSQLSENTRLRVSQSGFIVRNTSKNRLYMGDKAGNIPTKVFAFSTDSNPNGEFNAVWDPVSGYKDLTAGMTNIFFKHNGTEFFGLVEYVDGKNQTDQDFNMLHYSGEVIQRFGGDEFYAAARYENATVERDGDSADDELTQYQLALGWFLSKNAMMKLEYIKQERENIAKYGKDIKFDGFMFSAALSF
ncbi:hypothetical protein [Halarcobacter ebronensis]|uniref:Porin n=1 Tax=Halarcobacter ebronensis TaxID=1462615 RepID=A0A4V1M0S7_9BACT|nr:hypothetical protein [Halarcobacter ebronensis]QKF82241.1 hypothetical protein AEBR_1759 [Halarcobacter ebronensis]RXK07725.1 hypothetical protein CRV07_04495 [Halarcobacter ebronensis]